MRCLFLLIESWNYAKIGAVPLFFFVCMCVVWLCQSIVLACLQWLQIWSKPHSMYKMKSIDGFSSVNSIQWWVIMAPSDKVNTSFICLRSRVGNTFFRLWSIKITDNFLFLLYSCSVFSPFEFLSFLSFRSGLLNSLHKLHLSL